jgi:hypothetical protein
MPHNSESLRADFKYMFPAELPFLKSLPGMIDHSPCTVVNIGAGSGTSGLAFLECRDDLVLHTVDIQNADSPFGCLYAEREVVKAAGMAHLWDVRWFQYHTDSKALAAQWNGAPVGVCFIDGSHEYEDCAGDILGWLPHIRRGGIMAVHDYKKGEIPTGPNGYHADGPHPLVWEGVDQAVDELLVGKYSIIGRVDSLIAFRIG